jgi:hypothetical protein
MLTGQHLLEWAADVAVVVEEVVLTALAIDVVNHADNVDASHLEAAHSAKHFLGKSAQKL